MNTPVPFHLLFSTDSRFFVGALVSIGSTLDYADPQQPFIIHVLDTGLTKKHKTILEQIVRRHPNDACVVHKVDMSKFYGLTSYWNGGYAAYARLLMSSLIDDTSIEKCLYLDTDLLVMRDVTPLFKMDLGKHIAAMSIDGVAPSLSYDCPFDTPDNVSKYRYYNSGVMLVDLLRWRNENLEDIALSLAHEHPQQLRFYDQTVLNYLLRGKILSLDESWNFRGTNLQGATDIIYHFASGYKPWTAYGYRQSDKLWWMYYHLRCAPFYKFRYRSLSKKALHALFYRMASATPATILRNMSKSRFFPSSVKSVVQHVLTWHINLRKVSRKEQKKVYRNSFEKMQSFS